MDKYRRIINTLAVVFVLTIFGPVLIYLVPMMIEGHPDLEIVAPGSNDEPSTIVDGIDIESGLIVDDGYVLVKRNCAACHSLELVTQNRATRDGWKDIIRWMQETQGLWDLGADEKKILDYLGKNYAPKESGRRPNLENVEWYDFKD